MLKRRKMTLAATVKLGRLPEQRMMPVELVYLPEDPFRVVLVLHSARGVDVRKSISRELLAEGCEAPQMLGQHKVYPSGAEVVIDLRCGMTVRLMLVQVRAFIAQTYRMIPPDVEHPSAPLLPDVEAAVDEAVAVLLGGVR